MQDVELSDSELVRKTLRAIMQDGDAPAAAKAQAARTLAEMTQMLGRNQREPQDLTTPVKEMSRSQMEDALAAIVAARSGA